MKRINFLFGIHNHQPIGNFDFVFQEAYAKAYFPFLELIEKFPFFKISIHFTGILLDWIKENHPELIELIKELVKRGQLEIMTGGYYEPILSIIPYDDRIGQIRKLSEEVKQLFDFNPKGMWLAERVWEPTLPTPLSEAGIEYTITDDTHFKYAGLTEDQLTGYYITEDLGNSVKLFPISKRLRYTIPFEEPQQTIDYLAALASDDGNNIAVFADDGEKFGVWPHTHDHVYQNRWFERFLQTLNDNRSWINMMHFHEAVESVKPLGKIYLPTASYAEMMHWSLFPATFKAYEDFEHYLKNEDLYDDVHVFVRGGFWRNFFAKYTEVNDMHKKMLRVSNKLWKLERKKGKKNYKAFDLLWAGQCNCAYWHGVFGGLYLSHLRDAIYSNLIKAESLVDELENKIFPSVETVDLDVDGYEEIIVETKKYNAYISLNNGGMIYELDYKPVNKNILDTMTRRKEGYHEKLKNAVFPDADGSADNTASIHDLVLTKEPDLYAKLFYDFYERKSFIDHFLGSDTRLDTFASSQYKELGDFINNPYTYSRKIINKNKIEIELTRDGHVDIDGNFESVRIIKTYTFTNRDGKIYIKYNIVNMSDKVLKIWFAVEMNFGLQAGHASDRYYYVKNSQINNNYLDSIGQLSDINFIGLKDEWRKLDIQIKLDSKCSIWRFPIETISLSEAGFERVYQSSVVLPNWHIDLAKSWQMSFILAMNTI